MLLASTGCSGNQELGAGTGSEDESATVGAGMAGPVVDVKVTQEALDSKPAAPNLSTPESAVRSYLDWVSYAYRIGQSQVALPTMTTYQEVHVDSYVQYNIQQGRLIDQTLESLTLDTPVGDDTSMLVPATEKWTYSYVSIRNPGEVIGGPYEASYEATYTVVRSDDGSGWVVDSAEAAALNTVK